MPKWLVKNPAGEQELVETGPGGSYFDPSRIFWCWDGDGEPPVRIDLGHMERIEKIEPLRDNNGKQTYDIITTGEHKNTATKVPAMQLVTYLRNRKLGKTVKSTRPPKRIRPE